MPEQSQVEATTNEQSQELESQVEQTTDVLGQVSELLATNQEEPIQETEVKEEVQPEVKEEPKELIIDETMIQQYPRLKMYLGKPLMDLPKAYDNVVLAYQKDHLELIKLKQEQAKKSIPKPDEFPDPIDKPEEFKKALADYTKQVREQTLLEAQNQPQPIDWVSEVGKVLPQGTDARSVIDGFTKFNASRFYNQMGELRPDIERFYNEHPEVLLDEIKSFHNLYSNANKTQSTIAKEGKETAYKTITNSLKKAQENKDDLKGAQFNAVERSAQLSQEDEILAKIFIKAQGG